jgi:DNA-binding LacI/PurR family transcriptional regulator
MTVTLATIARKLNVSKVTVSLGLRGNPRISARMREQIVRVGAELGYKPHPMVSALMASLRKNRRPVGFFNLAFLTAFDSADGWREYPTVVRYFESARRHADILGYGVVHHWTGEARGSGKRLSTILDAGGIPGVIIAPLPRRGVKLNLDWARFAAVAIGWSFDEVPCHHVANNQFHSINTTLETCLRRGFRRIGFAVTRNVDAKSEHVWLSAYLGFHALHPELRKIAPCLLDQFTEADYAAWYKKNRPEVIITTHLDLVSWSQNLGLRIPDDIRFVHLDWNPALTGLSGMDQQPEEIGAAAVELLVDQISLHRRGIPKVPKSVHIEGLWQEGASLPSAPITPAAPARTARRKKQDTSAPVA